MTAWETFYETINPVFLCVRSLSSNDSIGAVNAFSGLTLLKKIPREDDFPRGIFIMLHSPAGV
jgi:hypothetical protein